jgi:putative transposase
MKSWTKPTSESLIGGAAADLLKNKAELVAENAFLRQQLIVMKRTVTQPKLTATDRGLLVALASRVRGWKSTLLIMKPDTLLKWHQHGFKLFWRLKSKGEARKPRISEETISLIKQMTVENRRWGAKRIRGELLKLGIHVNKGTGRRCMMQARRKLPAQPHDQTWATFLANHAQEIWASDFIQTYDLFFRTIFVFFIIEHSSRRVVNVGVTRSPSDEWVAQQIREATPFGEGPRYLVCDNDAKYARVLNPRWKVPPSNSFIRHATPPRPMRYVNGSSAVCTVSV